MLDNIKDADAIIFVGGISPQLEGEEMQVNFPGFNGGDSTSILLPAVQTELMKTLKATGKPVVFVMMTGSAIAIPWEAENIPAIVNAWYGGQSAGTAIADVLFGDYNPAGRLPVTFYKRIMIFRLSVIIQWIIARIVILKEKHCIRLVMD